MIAVPRRLAPGRKTAANYPYIASAGDYGRVIVYASQGGNPSVIDAFHATREDDVVGEPAFFLCDLATGNATRLPDPAGGSLLPMNVALLSHPSESLIIGLQPGAVAGRATLVCFSTLTNAWRQMELGYTPGGRPWDGHGVVTVGTTTVVWVDLSFGLLSWDLASPESREILFRPLPDGRELPSGTLGLDKLRFVGVCAGLIRYADITDGGVNYWTLVDQHWRLDCRTTFAAAGLPQGELPVIAFIHPEEEGVTYFLLRARLFGVHVSSGKVVASELLRMEQPPVPLQSSRFLLPWLVPEAILGKSNSVTYCTCACLRRAFHGS
jgi:hypothetical protein